VAGDDLTGVALELLRQMGAEELELITLYHGADVTARDAAALAEVLAAEYPNQEIEVREGGQAYYYYILSAE
jgi:dihydroxyacetone kinase-like predicted kinase